MKKTATLFFALSVILIGSMATLAQKRLLEDTNWRLVEAEGQTILRTAAAISFDARAVTFSGNTGCNTMSGSIDIRGKNIDFGAVRTTKRMCKLPTGSVAEYVVMNALEKARRFDVRNNSLRFYDRRGRTLVRFVRASAGDNSNSDNASKLDDRKWVLEQVNGRQTFVPLPYAFINFDAEKGSAGGNTSCNVFGGEYRVSGDSITFSNIVSTMRACVEDGKVAVEGDLLEGLRRATRYEIRGGRLHLYRGSEILLSFRGDNK